MRAEKELLKWSRAEKEWPEMSDENICLNSPFGMPEKWRLLWSLKDYMRRVTMIFPELQVDDGTDREIWRFGTERRRDSACKSRCVCHK